MTRIAAQISHELHLKLAQIQTTIDLLDAGNTVPFLARYRKEATGNLDETQIRQIGESLERLRALAERRETILATIEQQGRLTPELKSRIQEAETLTALEDLYQPYRPKRRTRASVARERGLEPLAQLILAQAHVREPLDVLARPYISGEVPTADGVWQGARDIVAETISDDPDVRGSVRDKALRYGVLVSEKLKAANDEKAVYEHYYDFRHRLVSIRPYQVLAINRGETEKILRVKVEVEDRDWLDPIHASYRPDRRSPLAEQLELAIEDGASRLLLPAIERDVRRSLSEKAEAHAIQVFADNLRGLLSQPPLVDRVVLGLDPAYRTGTKMAVVDTTGKVLETGTIYPHAPQNRWSEALKTLRQLIEHHKISLIAIGNGTASRETEQLVAELTRELDGVHYLMVNEAGASVYSASPLAKSELPDLDVSIRGAVSIARRVQDPLAELVKIDPKSIGVGLYQHDVDQKQLSQSLETVVESVVNQVGVNVNTASVALLTYVAGIGPKLAQNIVIQRDKDGAFGERKALKSVSGLGPKAFEQAAGFLRIRDGRNLLDASAIHPESYGVAEAVLDRAGLRLDTPPEEREPVLQGLKMQIVELARDLHTGVPTLSDIFEQLVRPGRDPREDVPVPVLRSDVLSMSDLKTGMVLSGTVRNVVDFGAFIDIGVKQDGLLHRSQIPRGERLTVGNVLDVSILNVDEERGRIGLGWV